MTLMPQTPKPFQDFFRVLARRDERLPYRMSFLLEDGGLNMGLKPLLAAILAFTNADNKRLNNAVETLRTLDLEGVCCVKFRICLCTWACVRENEQDAHLLLRRRVAELSKAVQGWGTCDVTEALTGEEDARLSGQAAIAGISVSEYMRRLFFGGRPLVAKTDGQTIRELRRLGGLLKYNFEAVREKGGRNELAELSATLNAIRAVIERLSER